MIVNKGLELTARYFGSKSILYVYKGAKLIWEAINSCFGSGFWIKEKAWSNTDSWRNN